MHFSLNLARIVGRGLKNYDNDSGGGCSSCGGKRIVVDGNDDSE